MPRSEQGLGAPASAEPDELDRRLRDRVACFAQEPRRPGGRHHATVRAAILAELSALGFRATAFPVVCAGPPCVNILADWPDEGPSDLPRLVIGAHYDSMPDAPGADDNASAVAALLEIARWVAPSFAGSEPRRRLELAFYDREEDGLVGSRAHARALAAAGAPVVMIALDMLGFAAEARGTQAPVPGFAGHDLPGTADFLAVCADPAAADLAARLARAMGEAEGPPVVPVIGPEVVRSPWTRLSDHSSFWDVGLPAMVVTDTGPLRNRHYHRPSDRPDTLDYGFLARGVRGLRHAVEVLLFNS